MIGEAVPQKLRHRVYPDGLKDSSVSGTALAAGVSLCENQKSPVASAIPLT